MRERRSFKNYKSCHFWCVGVEWLRSHTFPSKPMALRGSLQDALSVPLSWIWENCLPQMVVQAVFATYPVLLTSLCIRMIVLAVPLSQAAYDLISTLLGFWALWWYYEGSVLYFVLILLLVYMLLRVGTVGKRGVVVGGVCMLFVMVWYVHLYAFMNIYEISLAHVANFSL